MKGSIAYLLIGAVWAAPHVHPVAAAVMGSLCSAVAIISIWRGE